MTALSHIDAVADAIRLADHQFRKENGPAADYAERSYRAMAEAAIAAVRQPLDDVLRETAELKKYDGSPTSLAERASALINMKGP